MDSNLVDFRALCAELVGAWEAKSDFWHSTAEIVDRARTALALVPEGPAVTPAPAAAPDRPLYELMQKARHSTCCDGTDIYMLYAAELKVIANELEKWQLENYSVILPDVQEVLNWLKSEANKAENS